MGEQYVACFRSTLSLPFPSVPGTATVCSLLKSQTLSRVCISEGNLLAVTGGWDPAAGLNPIATGQPGGVTPACMPLPLHQMGTGQLHTSASVCAKTDGGVMLTLFRKLSSALHAQFDVLLHRRRRPEASGGNAAAGASAAGGGHAAAAAAEYWHAAAAAAAADQCTQRCQQRRAAVPACQRARAAAAAAGGPAAAAAALAGPARHAARRHATGEHAEMLWYK